ncbi:MAG: YicC family protein [Hyphomonadaceae bacterium]|nr:YicC family protein [Hyphomonadaceae bacterium]
MAISGMTGFARADGEAAGERGGIRWAWEARSVNSRGLDLKLRLPSGFEGLETVAREAAGKRFKRGAIQISLALKQEAAVAAAPTLNVDQVEALIAAGRPFVESGRVGAPSWDGLLLVRGVLAIEEQAPEALIGLIGDALAATLNTVLDGLAAARGQEGRALGEVLGGLVSRIEALTAEAKAIAAAGPAATQERIKLRLAALAPEVQLDPQRLAQEAALVALKGDVQEELDRLAAHAAEARSLLKQKEPAGRRLDFLAQEFAREANTLCSKSQDLALTRLGLDLKTAIDQVREQAANVE